MINIDAKLSNADWPKRTPDTFADLEEPVQKYDPDQPRDHGRFAPKGISIEVDGRSIEVVKPKRARTDLLVSVDVAVFDPVFAQSKEFYLSEGGGPNAISDRYARFGQFIAENDSIEAPEVYVGEDGRVGFTNGRHRYAWLRDHGITHIPVALSPESVKPAKKFGYISDKKIAWDESQRRDEQGRWTKEGAYTPDHDAPEKGEWDRTGVDPNAMVGPGPVWRQQHRQLVADALISWVGDTSTMSIHMKDAIEGAPIPGSGSGKQMRAQAEALLWELDHNATHTTVPVYRGSGQRGDRTGRIYSWSEKPEIAEIFAKRYGGGITMLQEGARGLRLRDYTRDALGEKQWLIRAGNDPSTKKFDEHQHPRDDEGKFTTAANPVAITGRAASHPGMEMVSIHDLIALQSEDRRVEPKSSFNITEPTETLLPRLTQELREGGAIQEPLTIAYDTTAGLALIADGNTRLAAITDAGFTHAPVIVSRQDLHGFGHAVPKLSKAQAGIDPFRNWLLPSEVGLHTLSKAQKFEEHQPRDAKGRFTDLGLHDGMVTLLHGTTRQYAEAIIEGGFKPGDPARVAAQIEDEYHLPKDSILNHVAFQFAKGRRDLDEVHFTTDESVADQYSVPEVMQDALTSAHMLLHPMAEDEPMTKARHEARKAWIAHEAARMLEPALLAVTVPFETVGQHSFGRKLTLEEFQDIQKKFPDTDSFFNNVRIPITALAGAKIRRRKREYARLPAGAPGSHGGEFSSTRGGMVVLHGPQDALDSLLNGERVNIDRDDVRAFLEKAAAQPEDPDLTDVHVEGMLIFGGNGLGIKRDDMPQIPREHRERFLKELRDAGIEITEEWVSPHDIYPTQSEISARRVGEKLQKYEDKPEKQFPPLLVSRDGHVLDGHHHWGMMAALAIDFPEIQVPVYRLRVTTKRALELMHDYDRRHHIKRVSLTGEVEKWDKDQPRDEQGQWAKSAVTAFKPEPIEQARQVQYKSREKLIEVSIKDFLALAEYGYSEDKAKGVAGIEVFNDLPRLSYELTKDGQAVITGHEGRHRARQLQSRGFTTMPVLLRGDIRWSEQTDPKSYDYMRAWPERLHAQADQPFSIPFPVTREDAPLPYKHKVQKYDKDQPRDADGKWVTLHRGEHSGNRGGGYYSPDFEFARQFTQSGLEREVKTIRIPKSLIYVPKEPVYASGEDTDAWDQAIAEARAQGFKAVEIDEGQGQPKSVYIFNKTALHARKADASGRFVTPFVDFSHQGDAQLQLIASLNSSRLATWGFTAEAEARGITRYKLSAKLDAGTSDFCRMIDGRVFDVPDARKKVLEALRVQDPQDLKVVQPWPKQTKAAIAAFKQMSSQELTDAGFHIPPFHPRCRTMCTVFGAKEKTPVPKLPAAVQDQTVTIETMKELGLTVTQEQVDYWNRHMGTGPVQVLEMLTGKQPPEILGKVFGTKAITFPEDGTIDLTLHSVFQDVKYATNLILDPFSGTLYLSKADLIAGTPNQAALFMQRLLGGMVETAESIDASSIVLLAGEEAATFATMGFIPSQDIWDQMRKKTLAQITAGHPSFTTLTSYEQSLITHLLESDDPTSLSALSQLSLTINGRPLVEWIVEGVEGGEYTLDMLNSFAVDQARAYVGQRGTV